MAKKIYIQAKKDIEALLQENGDSEICAGISEYSSVWKEAFNDERVDEGESIVDFKYTGFYILIIISFNLAFV